MQTIKVFLASSDELKNDRNALGNLVRQLDRIFEKRGIRIELFEWEDYDAAYNGCRKQDEYNDQIKTSDMFLAIFHINAGKYTIEEFNVACEEFCRTGKAPKSYVYCRDLLPNEQESEELREFKKRLFEEMGHYWCRYNNIDSLQLHFVMQLQIVENSRMDALKVEEGKVKLDDFAIASMDKLQFASGNDDYQRMSQRLVELPAMIERATLRMEKYPNELEFIEERQKLIEERNHLQEQFDQQMKYLLNTAMRITRIQGENITDRIHRAIKAFEDGNVHEANIILDEAELDANRNMENYRQSKEFVKQKRQNVIWSIEELSLKTSTLMADFSIPIGNRIEQTKGLYEQADQLAVEIDYDAEKFAQLLYEQGLFLKDFGFYKEAEDVFKRQIAFSEELYGMDSRTAMSFFWIGFVYLQQSKYNEALEYLSKSTSIQEKLQDVNLAASFHLIGMVYDYMCKYDKALRYFDLALSVWGKNIDSHHPNIGTIYSAIGMVHDKKGNIDKALEFHNKALLIFEENYGVNHSYTATALNNIGLSYFIHGHFQQAIEYYIKVIPIYEQLLGTEHPFTAIVYRNIGSAYLSEDEDEKASEYLWKSLNIVKKSLGEENIDTARSYSAIGSLYYKRNNYEKALDYYNKAYLIFERICPKSTELNGILDFINHLKESMRKTVRPKKGIFRKLFGK